MRSPGRRIGVPADAAEAIAFLAFSQAAMHSLQVFVQDDIFTSFPQVFSQLLQEAIQASHAAMQSLYLSLFTALFSLVAGILVLTAAAKDPSGNKRS